MIPFDRDMMCVKQSRESSAAIKTALRILAFIEHNILTVVSLYVVISEKPGPSRWDSGGAAEGKKYINFMNLRSNYIYKTYTYTQSI